MKEKKDYVPGRAFSGLPHQSELDKRAADMYDDDGRRYYLYTKGTFPELVAERGAEQMPDEGKGVFAFVVELPQTITRALPEFTFPQVQEGQSLQFFTATHRITAVVASGSLFPDRRYATGFLHLKAMTMTPKVVVAPVAAVDSVNAAALA